LVDRIDIHIEVPAVPYAVPFKELRGSDPSESPAAIGGRVEAARVGAAGSRPLQLAHGLRA